jgi:hypothetical protein
MRRRMRGVFSARCGALSSGRSPTVSTAGAALTCSRVVDMEGSRKALGRAIISAAFIAMLNYTGIDCRLAPG